MATPPNEPADTLDAFESDVVPLAAPKPEDYLDTLVAVSISAAVVGACGFAVRIVERVLLVLRLLRSCCCRALKTTSTFASPLHLTEQN